jgi:hypothetical protein
MLKTVGFPSTRTGDQTIVDGNLVIGTAGKGIDFSATSGTGTSELLDDYEEGAFTPTLLGATTTTYTTQTGTYTIIGRQVFFQGEIQINSLGNGSTTIMLLGGLPTAATPSTTTVLLFSDLATAVVFLTGFIGAAGGNSVQFQNLTAANAATDASNNIFKNSTRIMFSGQYSI